MADAIQIEQVMVNLVRNAIEAMQGPRRQITLRTAVGEGGFIEVAVADTGPGLAPEVQQHLFQPFFTTKSSGMGMGLSISRSIIEAHEGQLSPAPNPSGGATFSFVLPAKEGTDSGSS